MWARSLQTPGALQEKISALSSGQKDPAKWTLPEGNSHHELMIREFVLRLRGEWDYPYKDEEICHVYAP